MSYKLPVTRISSLQSLVSSLQHWLLAACNLLLATCLLLIAATPVFAQGKEWTTTEEDAAQFKDLEIVFENILGIIFPLAGIAVFIMLLVGGFQKLTSGGDPKANEKAAKTITYAIIGLALLVGIWFILRFIKEFTGVDVTEFKIISE